LEKTTISSSQLLFSVALFITGAVIATTYAVQIMKQNTWVVAITGFLASTALIWVYLKMALCFPGKNLAQILQIIYGPFLGKLIGGLYFSYFWLVLVANIRAVTDAINMYFLPETPMIAIFIALILVCAQAVSKGIEVIVRIALPFILISLLSLLITSLLLIPEMKFSNLLPLFDYSPMDLLQGTHIIAAIPFCEVIIFLMFIPHVPKIRSVPKSVIAGTALGFFFLFATTLRTQVVLGDLNSIVTLPVFEAVRFIDIANIFTRVELLIVIVYVLTASFKIFILYYATTAGISQLLKLKSYLPLILPLGVISISYAVIIYDYDFYLGYNASYFWPIFTIPFQIAIPLISLLLIKIRGLEKQGEKTQ